jgi:hypothetical protein
MLETKRPSSESSPPTDGEIILSNALREGLPVIAVLGQMSGWNSEHQDPVLTLALKKASGAGENWRSLLSRIPLPEGFFEWLGERFSRRAPSQELLATADAAFSAIYTSSIDPGLTNLFATAGRQPEPILLGDPPPPVLRSRRRLPVYYLFGRAGAGVGDFKPPASIQELSQRRLRHASAMLRTLNETATALGLIVVDGFDSENDWLRAEDLLAMLGPAPIAGVLWCGAIPKFSEDDAETFQSLVDQGVIISEPRSVGLLLSSIRAGGQEVGPQHWDDPEIVSLADDKKLVTTARLRLSTQASAAIVDDSWLSFLPPLNKESEASAFLTFHAVPKSPLGLVEGVRRDYAIKRDFEDLLQKRVSRAIAQHHDEKGAIILHGQSGIGKTVALGRLAVTIRENKAAAVLFAYNRLVQATDVADFLAEVDKIGGVTVLIVDATIAYQRYDDLLQAFRSRGHRVVVVGTSYRIEQQQQTGKNRFVEANADLSANEEKRLVELSERFAKNSARGNANRIARPHALARFFWELPSSRTHLSEGLGREARAVEVALRHRGALKRPIQTVGGLGEALLRAGYAEPTTTLFQEDEVGPGGETAAGRVIDYVMAASRLYKSVPVNLVLRSVLNSGIVEGQIDSIELVRELFEGQDIFRWRFADEQGEELLVGARLQIEAQLVCDRRLGGPSAEASRLIELIRNAVRAGAEDNEETKFVADLVYAVGPDGPLKDRYKDSYADFARALTELRENSGVLNARLMLQEATLRRVHVRNSHTIDSNQKVLLLDEARAAIDGALRALDEPAGRKLYAAKRTRDNLWVERAATYGFLATDIAQRGGSSSEIWSSYKAAREAVRMATGRVDTYFPLDIGLWVPADVLRSAAALQLNERFELEADIRSTLDSIDPENLDSNQVPMFQRQRMRVGDVLGDVSLAEEAFKALQVVGSTAGYYLRARAMVPPRAEIDELPSREQQSGAKNAANYLWSVYNEISGDSRCLTLLLSCEWVVRTGRWLFKGQRQPIPFETADRARLRSILLDLRAATSNQMQSKYRYLEAMLDWLTNDELGARDTFRQLARDTEYLERGRVVSRHLITDKTGKPMLFEGVVEKRLGERRWTVFISELSRRVDLIERETGISDIVLGRTVRDFYVAFNYLGPIADLQFGPSRRS